MYQRFAFEGDIHDSLDCVPMAVRRKLDLACLKISLSGWQALSRSERLALCHLPVDGAGDLAVYVEVLQSFAAQAGVELKPLPPPDRRWQDESLPPEVARRLESVTVNPEIWEALSEDARYALTKLADPKREPEKLVAAAIELGLAEGTAPALAPIGSCVAAA